MTEGYKDYVEQIEKHHIAAQFGDSDKPRQYGRVDSGQEGHTGGCFICNGCVGTIAIIACIMNIRVAEDFVSV